MCPETTVQLYRGTLEKGLHRKNVLFAAVFRKCDTHQRRHQAPSGSGGLFSGACNRPDNEIFAEFLNNCILWKGIRRMEDIGLHSGSSVHLHTNWAWCVFVYMYVCAWACVHKHTHTQVREIET